MAVLRDSTWAASASTVTCSVTAPTFRLISTVGLDLDLQHDPGLRVLAETLLSDFHQIGTNGKIRQHITAVGTASGSTDHAGSRLRRFDRSRPEWRARSNL